MHLPGLVHRMMERGLQVCCLSLALLIGTAGPLGAASTSPGASFSGNLHREACLDGRTSRTVRILGAARIEIETPSKLEGDVFSGPRCKARVGRHGAIGFTLPCLARPQMDFSSAACRWIPGTRALPIPTLRKARIVGGRRGDGAARGGLTGLAAKLRDEELDALSIDLIAQFLGKEGTAETLVKKAFRKLGDRIANEQRQQVSRRVLGVAVLHVRLAFVVDWVDAVALTNSSDPTILNSNFIPEMISRPSVVLDRPSRENAQVPQTLDTLDPKPQAPNRNP